MAGVNPASLGAKTGLIVGMLCLLYLSVLFFASPHLLLSLWILCCLAFIILFKIGSAFFLWQQNKEVSFKDALGSIFMVSVLSLGVIVIFYYIMINYVDTSLLDPLKEKLTENATKSLNDGRITKEQFDIGQSRISEIRFSAGMASMVYSILLFVGFFYSLVFAGIIRLISRDIAMRGHRK